MAAAGRKPNQPSGIALLPEGRKKIRTKAALEERRAPATDEVTLDIAGKSVRCTLLSKVLYPKARFTKAEVIDYYVRVAPFLLPHLKGRPLSLKRFPDGVKGEVYWDKD